MEYGQPCQSNIDLLSAVLHELCTPLAIIKGYATMLLDHDWRLASEEGMEYLEGINSATDRLADIVEHFLETSRRQASLLELKKEPTSIAELIHEAVTDSLIWAPAHKIIPALGRGLPLVGMDRRRIRQVLDNLVENAVKYSDKGTTVVVQARRAGSVLLIGVSDQGIGIPADELDRVFDWGRRLESKLSGKTVGFGLGLAICKEIVEAHGGRMWMESEKGKGSTCWFILPLAQTEAGPDMEIGGWDEICPSEIDR